MRAIEREEGGGEDEQVNVLSLSWFGSKTEWKRRQLGNIKGTRLNYHRRAEVSSQSFSTSNTVKLTTKLSITLAV